MFTDKVALVTGASRGIRRGDRVGVRRGGRGRRWTTPSAACASRSTHASQPAEDTSIALTSGSRVTPVRSRGTAASVTSRRDADATHWGCWRPITTRAWEAFARFNEVNDPTISRRSHVTHARIDDRALIRRVP
jgi:hypothetical protein